MADKNKLLDKENNPHGEINVKFLVPNKDPKDTTGTQNPKNFPKKIKKNLINRQFRKPTEILRKIPLFGSLLSLLQI
jgi:hypothetical protein